MGMVFGLCCGDECLGDFMNAAFYQSQVKKLLAMVEQGKGDEADETTTLYAADYLDEGKLAAEKAMFRRLPLLVGHASEIPNPGDFIVREPGDVHRPRATQQAECICLSVLEAPIQLTGIKKVLNPFLRFSPS